ncbi:MAG: mannose-1-phosphate guanylyltransferase [Chloroflexota bacterium]
MLNHYYAVIMAGGGGTRLWPLSRQTRPKQMLSLFDERTLFQTSVQRLHGVFSPERIFVVTVEEQAAELHAQCPEIPFENFLLEPMPRNTAPAIGLAATVLHKFDSQAVMAVLTSDHYIGNDAYFRQTLQAAYNVAQDGYLVTLGIEPTFPAMGFGYVQRGEHLGIYHDQSDTGFDVFRVRRFKEKPDEAQARAMLETGDHAWNSGMFVWRTERILAEFKRQMPGLAAGLERIEQAWETPDRRAILQDVWAGLEAQSIDYGIMENANDVAMLPASGLNWSDVGSWDSLFELLEGDKDGNIIMGGTHVGLDTRKSLVYVNQERRLIVTIGVEDLVLVDTGDVLLVCHKDQAQRVRQVVNQLKEDGKPYF